MQRQRGFTVLELIIAIVILLAAGGIFYVQKRNLEIAKTDSQAKTAINAIYYNLEDVYFPVNLAYPEHLTADQLKGLNPADLKDPSGKAISDQGSTYRYEPKDCTSGKCKSYTLTADLQNEGDFVKTNRNQ